MKKKFKNLFLKALWIGIKGFILLPVILYVINDTLDTYGYAQDTSSYSIKTFVFFSILLLLNFALIIFTKIKIWKFLTVIVITIPYVLMHFYNDDIIHSYQRSICIEGNYNDCVIKDQFEEP